MISCMTLIRGNLSFGKGPHVLIASTTVFILGHTAQVTGRDRIGETQSLSDSRSAPISLTPFDQIVLNY